MRNLKDSHLFKVARECSLQSDYCGHARIGCILVYHGTILAKGWNSDKTHTMQSIYNVRRFKNCGNRYLPDKQHAELCVIAKTRYLDIDWSKVHLYIYRELKDGTLAMARPCKACWSAIEVQGIRHIHYTTDKGYAYERIEKDF